MGETLGAPRSLYDADETLVLYSLVPRNDGKPGYRLCWKVNDVYWYWWLHLRREYSAPWMGISAFSEYIDPWVGTSGQERLDIHGQTYEVFRDYNHAMEVWEQLLENPVPWIMRRVLCG